MNFQVKSLKLRTPLKNFSQGHEIPPTRHVLGDVDPQSESKPVAEIHGEETGRALRSTKRVLRPHRH